MFENNFFLQLRGTVMGSNVAQSYATLYISFLEEMFIYMSHHSSNILGWWRYIDDVFLIWIGSPEELFDFHSFLNNMDLKNQFSMVSSTTAVEFLDTMVFIHEGNLHTNLYKLTDKNTILKYESCHPKKMIRSLPYSQMLWVCRIVGQEKEVDLALQRMINNFLQREYLINIVEDHRGKV